MEMNMRRRIRDRKCAARLRPHRADGRTLPLTLLLLTLLVTSTQPMRAHAATVAAAATTAQRGKITDPAAAAARLYNAWKGRNRVAALKVAGRETVDKLLGVRWRAMQSKGCARRDEGGFQCIYYDAKSDLALSINVEGGASAGYAVESVSFSTEH